MTSEEKEILLKTEGNVLEESGNSMVGVLEGL